MKKHLMRTLAALLTVAMLLPLMTAVNVVFAEEVQLFEEDFSRFSEYEVGQKLTKGDGFGDTPPSTASVQKRYKNPCVGMDFASGYENPDDKVYYIPGTYEIVEEGTEGALCTDLASYGLISGRDSNIDKGLHVKNPAISYEEHEKIIVEVKYFLNKGSF